MKEEISIWGISLAFAIVGVLWVIVWNYLKKIVRPMTEDYIDTFYQSAVQENKRWKADPLGMLQNGEQYSDWIPFNAFRIYSVLKLFGVYAEHKNQLQGVLSDSESVHKKIVYTLRDVLADKTLANVELSEEQLKTARGIVKNPEITQWYISRVRIRIEKLSKVYHRRFTEEDSI